MTDSPHAAPAGDLRVALRHAAHLADDYREGMERQAAEQIVRELSTALAAALSSGETPAEPTLKIQGGKRVAPETRCACGCRADDHDDANADDEHDGILGQCFDCSCLQFASPATEPGAVDTSIPANLDGDLLRAASELRAEAGSVAYCMYCDRQAAWPSDERKALLHELADAVESARQVVIRASRAGGTV